MNTPHNKMPWNQRSSSPWILLAASFGAIVITIILFSAALGVVEDESHPVVGLFGVLAMLALLAFPVVAIVAIVWVVRNQRRARQGLVGYMPPAQGNTVQSAPPAPAAPPASAAPVSQTAPPNPVALPAPAAPPTPTVQQIEKQRKQEEKARKRAYAAKARAMKREEKRKLREFKLEKSKRELETLAAERAQRRVERRANQAATAKRKRKQYVQVVFCELHEDINTWKGTYTYLWPFDTEPTVGSRVFNDSGDAVAVVALGKGDVPAGVTIAKLHRLPTQRELRVAADAQDLKWHVARHKVKLPPLPGAPAATRHKDVPPLSTRGAVKNADTYGRQWWKLYKRAEEQGRADEEVRAYEAEARAWFKIRDRGGRDGVRFE